MKSENSKLVTGLVVGAAVGAAVAYLLTSDKKEDWVESLGEVVKKAKRKFGDIVQDGVNDLETVVDKIHDDPGIVI